MLQPHKGPSVTIGGSASFRASDASTPQGSVCNYPDYREDGLGFGASTPQGSVCNYPQETRSLVVDWLQPHKGPSVTVLKQADSEETRGELQPHKGPSVTTPAFSTSKAKPSFNPTRVRL